MRIRSFSVFAAAFVLALIPAAGQAQVSAGAKVGLTSAYVWRGLTVANRPVIQPEVFASVGPLTVDAWSNVQPFAYDGENDLSALNGLSAPNMSEVDLSAEVAKSVGRANLALGGIAYLYRNGADVEPVPNTFEVYGRAGVAPVPVTVSAYADVRAVKGVYFEAAAQQAVPHVKPLVMGAKLGASVGEAEGPLTSYFMRDGFTHVEGSLAAPFTYGGFSFSPELHISCAADDAAKRTSAMGDHRLKGWVMLNIGFPAGGND